MDRVLEALAGACAPAARFLRVEAEEVDDLAERYDVAAVPHFLIFKARRRSCAREGALGGWRTSATFVRYQVGIFLSGCSERRMHGLRLMLVRAAGERRRPAVLRPSVPAPWHQAGVSRSL